jgi:hypothetical protein
MALSLGRLCPAGTFITGGLSANVLSASAPPLGSHAGAIESWTPNLTRTLCRSPKFILDSCPPKINLGLQIPPVYPRLTSLHKDRRSVIAYGNDKNLIKSRIACGIGEKRISTSTEPIRLYFSLITASPALSGDTIC